MTKPPIFEVSVMEKLEDGRWSWHTLLRTRDRAEAQALLDSLMADEGVKARMVEEPE